MKPCFLKLAGSGVNAGNEPRLPLTQVSAVSAGSTTQGSVLCTSDRSVQLPRSKDQPAHAGFAVQDVQHCAKPPVRVAPQAPGGFSKPPTMRAPVLRTWFELEHSACRKWLMKFHTCVLLGRRPVVKLLRDGEQTASWQ